jgi:uncharacterized phage protein gp47/JayE
MINVGVTAAGFVRDSLETILTKFTDRAKLIFGSDVDLSPSTKDAQFIGVFAEAVDDVAQIIENVYNGRDPDHATGQNLTATCRLNGVNKNIGSYAVVNVSALVLLNATVPAGTQVADAANGAVYAFQTEVIGTGSPVLVSCLATTMGVTSLAGDVTVIVQPTYGLVSVTNPASSTAAAPVESDEALRLRRNASTASPTQALVDSVRAGVLAIPTIGKMRLWENDTGIQANAKIGDAALPQHSITAVVVSGSATDIATAIYRRKSLGCSTVGDQVVQVSDSAGNAQPIRYYVATPVRLFVKLTYRERPGQGFGTGGGEDAVKAALAAWVATYQQPGADAVLSFLNPPALASVPGLDGLPSIMIEGFELGRAADATHAVDLATAFNEIVTLDVGDITMVALT